MLAGPLSPRPAGWVRQEEGPSRDGRVLMEVFLMSDARAVSRTVLPAQSSVPPGELNTDSTATWRCGAPLLSSRFAVGPCEVHTKILLLKHSACGQTRVALLARVSIVTCLFRLSGHRFRESLACCLWNPLPEIPMATAVCQFRFSTFGVCAGCCRVQGDSPNPPSPDLCWIVSNAPGVL